MHGSDPVTSFDIKGRSIVTRGGLDGDATRHPFGGD